jgi:glycosyltransferase involved in cell wall biosynthesis
MENEKNLGLGETRNVGMKAARGKYVYFMDSDDMILEDTLEMLYSIAEEKQADVVHMNSHYRPYSEEFHYGDEKNGLRANIVREDLMTKEVKALPENLNDRLDIAYVKQGVAVMVWLNLYRRKFLMENNIYSLPIICQDTPFTLACLVATSRIWIVPSTMYLYRQRAGSITYDKSMYRRAGRLIKTLVVGLRYIEEEIPRLLPEGETISIASLKAPYFYKMYAKLLELFDKVTTREQTVRLVDAVDAALRPLIGKDSFLVNILLYNLQFQQRKVEALKGRREGKSA